MPCLAGGHPPDTVVLRRYTPLHNAARKGFGAVAQVHGFCALDVFSTNRLCLLSARAVALGRFISTATAAQVLIQHGADINAERNDRKTPAEVCADCGLLLLLLLLLC